MRFGTRFDRWQAWLLSGIGLLLFSLPLALHSTLAASGEPLWPLLPGPALFILVLSATLPQYYELREQGLYIRQGWRKKLLPYADLRELRIWNSPLSAPVFSTHRLMITATAARQFVIAVAEQERFLTEIAQRAPQLESGLTGLKTRDQSRVCS